MGFTVGRMGAIFLLLVVLLELLLLVLAARSIIPSRWSSRERISQLVDPPTLARTNWEDRGEDINVGELIVM